MDKCPLCNETGGHLIGCRWPNMVKRNLHLTQGTVALCKQIVDLQTQLAALHQRLVEAEGLLERSRIALVAFLEGTLVNDADLMDDLNAFLTPTAPKEPDSCCGGLILSDGDCWECDKCGRTWPRIEVVAPREHVLVRRDDLEQEVKLVESLKTYRVQSIGFDADYHNRLKAAVEGGKP
jgi:hypothetical protein